MPSDGTQAPGTVTVGFIGLGNMGVPMVTNLVAAGHTVVASDLSPDARARAAAAGATAVETAREVAARSGIVILMLPDSTIVAAVVGDIAASLAPDSLVIDMSSSEPLRTRALAAQLAEDGIRLVDAPVSGGVSGAVKGSLTIMVGGEPADVDEAAAVLAPMGRVVRAGGIGAGHAIKALNNLLSATHLWITAEAMEVGERFGLDPATMLEVFNSSSGRSGSTENKYPNFILPGSFDSGFGLRLMLKDMRIAVQLGEQVGKPSVLGADAVGLWARAADDLDPAADHTRIAEWVRTAEGGAIEQ
ncbi:NAD(P)-dependent oxidoreductase [Herbiconiux sp. UC225_62]|uniref:NAD(P)-dependent oxidoreductase n=1 Tax=Herbiconiux sp. UC225_62 TaxID=3350168 RepID=UPI0036D3660B